MSDTIQLNLALQGGGAHGAFTWGILDRLLEEPWFTIKGISGSSAGAMNAVMLAEGWRQGGRDGARCLLEDFWRQVSVPLDVGQAWQLPFSGWWDSLSQTTSPYDLNPFDINPLRDLVRKLVDFDQLQEQSPFHLFIAATEINSGRLHLFREQELQCEHLLASACLPRMSQAVEIGGRFFWDGGFAANPALYPLLFQYYADDLLLVLLQPLEQQNLPRSAQAISDRIAELSFQTAFMREMRGVVNLQRYVNARPWLLGRRERQLRRLRFHMIGPDEMLAALHRRSRYNTQRDFIFELKMRGGNQAERWLKLHRNKVGKRTSCRLQRYFL